MLDNFHYGCSINFSIGSSDKSIKIWNPESGTLISTLKGCNSDVRCLLTLVLNEKVALISGSKDKLIKFWNADIVSPFNVLAEHTGEIRCLATTNVNGQVLLISGGEDNTI